MSLVSLLCGRLLRVLQSILGVVKRALCFMRKRDNIGELPFTVVVRQSAPEDPYPTAVAPGGWDDHWEEKQAVEEKIDEWRRKKAEVNQSQTQKNDDIDFFNDMQPDIKKAKKVVLKPRINQHARENRNLFGFSEDAPVNGPLSAQLGDLDDAEMPAWDDDIDSTLNQHRAEKHRMRMEEHDRRLREKRGQRAATGGYHYEGDATHGMHGGVPQ
uniref:Receptor-binding cancer antigen expressed on SiSo cells n=1 Tax=Haemonchus contortus TaxID=6289 RepID=A0A7I4Z1R5_HAECO